jgi:hypothetical protein
MFCPDCGTSNLKGQKFCTRCGANLIAIDRAREILGEIGAGVPANQVDASMILKIVALVGIFGFLFVTGAVIALGVVQYTGPPPHNDAPVSVFVGFLGYGALVLICRQLLRLIGPSQVEPKRSPAQPPYAAPAAVPGSTNRSLGEGAPAYHSVTEQTTKQFEAESPRRPAGDR